MIHLQGAEIIWKREPEYWHIFIKHGGNIYDTGVTPQEAKDLANHILQMEKDIAEVRMKGTFRGKKVVAKTEFIKAVDSPKE